MKSLLITTAVLTVTMTPLFAWQDSHPKDIQPNIYVGNMQTIIHHSPIIPVQAQAWYINQQRREHWRRFHHRHDNDFRNPICNNGHRY